MNCQNNFCIYWDNKKCILDEISLNICGQCEECVLIDIDEELSQMIIFQQSYAACAQVFTASREILDILLGLV